MSSGLALRPDTRLLSGLRLGRLLHADGTYLVDRTGPGCSVVSVELQDPTSDEHELSQDIWSLVGLLIETLLQVGHLGDAVDVDRRVLGQGSAGGKRWQRQMRRNRGDGRKRRGRYS